MTRQRVYAVSMIVSGKIHSLSFVRNQEMDSLGHVFSEHKYAYHDADKARIDRILDKHSTGVGYAVLIQFRIKHDD